MKVVDIVDNNIITGVRYGTIDVHAPESRAMPHAHTPVSNAFRQRATKKSAKNIQNKNKV